MNFLSYLAEFFLERELFDTKIVEKIEINFTFNNFFPEHRALYEDVKHSE
jgi:hypothetical protein